MSISIICPNCSNELSSDIFAAAIEKEDIICEGCLKKFININGCIDFAIKSSSDKNFYEKIYQGHSSSEKRELNFEELRKLWLDPTLPARKIFLNEIKKTDIKEKTILLLGNGQSLKELYFLTFGAKLIYTDISLNAVTKVKNTFELEKYNSKIVFHAVNAYNIPISDESVDIIVGYGFAHHLQDTDLFIKEICRVLKPEGKCLFKDNAYSKGWQKIKFTIFKPLVKYSHKKWGISPEDRKATRKGGYSEEEVENWRVKYNFSEKIFLRFGILSYIFRRGVGKTLGYNKFTDALKKITIPFFSRIDNFFSKKSTKIKELTIELIWGFKK